MEKLLQQLLYWILRTIVINHMSKCENILE